MASVYTRNIPVAAEGVGFVMASPEQPIKQSDIDGARWLATTVTLLLFGCSAALYCWAMH
jgi:hypothetical protein